MKLMGKSIRNLRSISRLSPWALPCAAAFAAAILAAGAHGAEPKSAPPLARRVSITWQQVPLAVALDRLAETQSIAVWCDRRVDPQTSITLTAVDQPLAEALAALGRQAGAAAVPFGGIIYFGPQQTADELATLAALARQPLAAAPTAARAKWLRPKAWSYPRLSEPRRLLAELLAAADAQVLNEPEVPHDLWPARKLPPLAVIDRVVLLLAGFDLTCRVSEDGAQLVVIPITRPVAVERQYRVPAGRLAAFNAAFSELNGAASTELGSTRTISARIEDHDRLQAVLSGRPDPAVAAAAAMRSASQARGGSALEDRRFTLTIENKPLEPVLNQLADQLNLQLEWDPAIPDGDSRRIGLVSCRVVTADLDGLLKALLEPAGLAFERQERLVSIREQ
jgi:hypothetical protein